MASRSRALRWNTSGPKTRTVAHIYVYSPSSAVRDRAAFRRGLRRLAALGHEVEVDTGALTQHMRFAGTTLPAWPPSTARRTVVRTLR